MKSGHKPVLFILGGREHLVMHSSNSYVKKYINKESANDMLADSLF